MRILFFIFILFSIISVINFSQCLVGEKCENHDGIIITSYLKSPPISGKPAQTLYYGAIAVNENTGQWFGASKQNSKKEARDFVISLCGKQCKIIDVLPDNCTGLAYSASDKIIGYDSAVKNDEDNNNDTRVKRANEKALEKCQENGGKNCKIIVNVCALEGTTR